MRTGVKPSEQTRKNMSKAQQARKKKFGYIHSMETRKKISEALKGKHYKRKPFSEKHKQRMSEVKKGARNPMFGNSHSEEARKKISEATKGKNNPFFGKHHDILTRKKMSLAAKGKHANEKNSNWHGGITPLYGKIRGSDKYDQWRKKVFTRDNFTCQQCGSSKSGSLNAHHIKPFSEIITSNKITTYRQAIACKELWNIDNGITLCKACHLKTYKNYHSGEGLFTTMVAMK